MVSLVLAGMVTFILLYDSQALLPAFHDSFAVTPAQAALSMSLATAGLALGLLVAGPASERLGRTTLIVGSMWAASVIAVLCPLAWSWESLLSLRFIQGFALAGLPAVATAYLREELHHSTHARAAGIYIGGTALGGMMGRLLTAPVAEWLNWRWGLGVAAAVSLVCATAVTLLLPASENFARRPTGQGGVRSMSRTALADPALRRLYALGACAVGALVLIFNALGFRLVAQPHQLSLGAISLLYLVYPIGTLSSALSGVWADRVGRRALMPIGCALAIIGVALTLPDSIVSIVIGLALFTAGFFVVHGLASGWVAVRAHAVGASASQAAAFYLFSYYVGSSVLGNLGASAWSAVGWVGPAAMALSLLGLVVLLTASLRRVPTALGVPSEPSLRTSAATSAG